MKYIFTKPNLLFCVLCLALLSSCVSRKNMVYFQEVEQLQQGMARAQENNLEIKPDDVLTIRVSAAEQQAATPFNLTKTVGSQGLRGDVELETYLVSNQGTIEFPVLGTIEVEGMTNIELSAQIKDMLGEYLDNPIVNVRIMNFHISVLGEVNNPGRFEIEDDHITLAEALGLAGDLTIFGRRTNILVLSNEGGVKTYNYLDLTDADVVKSPYYNLRQNDVIYVEPRASKRQTAGSLSVAATYLSIASVIASIVVLITK